MSKAANRDLLLLAAKAIVYLAIGAMAFAAVLLSIGTVAVLTVERAEILTELASSGAPAGALWLLVGFLALVVVLLALGLRFAKELLGIINSVGEGDPFAPENGDRLNRMAWLAVAGQVLGMVLAGVTLWFAPFAEKAGKQVDFGFGMDLSGVLLTLILFILARVFRHGAAMQAELEGTV